MILFLRDLFYGVAILAGMGSVYTTLGTLNGRLSGGFTTDNLPWAISLGVFAGAVVGCTVIKLILLARRRRQRPIRIHKSGTYYLPIDSD